MPDPQSCAEWHRLAAELHHSTGHFPHGEHVATWTGRITVGNPAAAETLCEVAAGDATDIDAAVASGRRAFREGTWRRMTPRDRLEVFNRLEAGTTGVNCFDHGDPTSPFPGHKQPGQGGDKSLEGPLSYTPTKSASIHPGS